MAFPGGAHIGVVRQQSAAPSPVMQLDFLNNATLPDRITFSRGTGATLIDSTGRLTYAPNNLVFNSADVTNASWNKLLGGVAASATTFNFASTFGSGFENSTAAVLPVGSRVIASFLASGTGTIEIGIVDASGAFGGTFQTVALTATPTRYFVQRTLVDANCLLRVRNTSGVAVTGATCTQMQLEAVTYQTTPSTYVATTASAYYGPRFDYDPVTLAPRGLLIEEARTNLLTYSDDWSNAAWAKSAATVTANNTASPDGTVNADKLVEDTATSTHSTSQGFSGTSGTSYTFSLYAKAAERNWIAVQFSSAIFADALSRTAYVNLATGAIGTLSNAPTVTVTNAANGWWRVTITVAATATSASAAVFVYLASADNTASYLGNGTSGAFLYGAQLEAGSFATSYIPTVASTVTRNADVATMTGTNFSSWYNQSEGTFVSAFDVISTAGVSKAVVTTNDGTSNNLNLLYVSSGAVPFGEIRSGGAVQALMSSATITAITVNAGALAYKVNDFASAVNGGAVATDTAGAVAVNQNALNIGYSSNFAGLYINGHIRVIAYFNTRLPNAQLQTLTAPSLATTLSLDFTSGSYNVGF